MGGDPLNQSVLSHGPVPWTEQKGNKAEPSPGIQLYFLHVLMTAPSAPG